MRLIIPFIIVLPFIFVFWFSLPTESNHEAMVTKVIDGDTFLIEGGQKVRMLGIDADERGYPCYNEAKVALEQMILNKRVLLEPGTDNKDKYGRLLRWVWINGTLVNLELVKKGLAVARFEKDSKYRLEITNAEHEAIVNKIGCKWSLLE